MLFESDFLPNLTIAALGTMGLIGVGVSLVRGSLYDIKEVKSQRGFKRSSGSAKFRRRQLISVLVVARNSKAEITECLNSIAANRYRKYEVIVIDNASKDKTTSSVKSWQRDHHKIKLKLTTFKKLATREDLVTRGLKKSTGEIVVLLGAEQLVSNQFLQDINLQFGLIGSEGLELNSQVLPAPSLLNLLQRFEYVIAHRWHKGRSWTHKESKSVLRRPTAYQRSALERLLKNQSNITMHFAAKIAVRSHASPSYYQLINRHTGERSDSWQLARDLGAVAVSYLLYLAIYLKTPAWYSTLWLSVSLLAIFIIATTSQLSIGHRLRLICLTPLVALLFYVLSVIETVAFYIGSAFKLLIWPFRLIIRHA